MKRLVVIILLALVSAAHADVVRRPLPDYDGRRDPPADAGDVALWVPRVIVFPLWLISEFVLRRPLRAIITAGEQGQWPIRFMDFLFDRPAGLIPTFYVDLGLKATVGLYFFWNDAIVYGNQVRATASLSSGVLTGTLTDRYTRGPWRFSVRGHASTRNDGSFHGLGPDSLSENLARYEQLTLEASASLQWRFSALGSARLEAGWRLVDFGTSACCGDPPIGELVEAGLIPPPPGFAEGGHNGPFARLRFSIQSRPRLPATGVGLILDFDQGSDLETDRVWVRGGATVAASIDVTGRRRVFSLILHGELSTKDTPFNELPAVGGSHSLPGFRSGRLADGSALSATLQYEWPIWAFLGGVLHVGAGNVFARDLSDVDVDLMRLSTGVGIRSLDVGDHRFEVLVAFGSRPFGLDFGLDEIRFVLGGVTAF